MSQDHTRLPPTRGEGQGLPVAVEPVTLGDALVEIAYLRQALQGAIIGDRIIAEQLARADTAILQWAHRQATANMEHTQTCLNESRADFPFEGRKDLAWAEGRASQPHPPGGNSHEG